jgi:hypothetical protein
LDSALGADGAAWENTTPPEMNATVLKATTPAAASALGETRLRKRARPPRDSRFSISLPPIVGFLSVFGRRYRPPPGGDIVASGGSFNTIARQGEVKKSS